MHDMKSFIKTPLSKLDKLNAGDKLELLTYKKDRKIIIIKKDLSLYDVIEDGFKYKKFEDIKFNQLEKLLEKLKSIEFPRSHKYFLKITPSHNFDQMMM